MGRGCRRGHRSDRGRRPREGGTLGQMENKKALRFGKSVYLRFVRQGRFSVDIAGSHRFCAKTYYGSQSVVSNVTMAE